MKNRFRKGVLCVCTAFVCTVLCFVGAIDKSIADSVSAFSADEVKLPSYAEIEYESSAECGGFGYKSSVYTDNASVKVFGIPFKRITVDVYKDIKVIPGGEVFGVKLKTRGVLVVGIGACSDGENTSEPAKEAGIRINDTIISINGIEIGSSAELTKIITGSKGEKLHFLCERAGKKYETDLTAVFDETGSYKAGLWVRDTVAGIGTVTFTDPEGVIFGGLGHGICESETGELMQLGSGEIYEAYITGIKQGKQGEPGELRGYFGKTSTGELILNTDTGVFGKYYNERKEKDTVQIALKDEINEGAAKIYSTVDGEGVKEYDAEIIRVISYESETKNFIIRITDKELLEKTGGIVQGMSGSPIIQNGKLIGAVTHVLINDPCKGYGIFIENMLKAAEKCR